jgi:hypothetical protein
MACLDSIHRGGRESCLTLHVKAHDSWILYITTGGLWVVGALQLSIIGPVTPLLLSRFDSLSLVKYFSRSKACNKCVCLSGILSNVQFAFWRSNFFFKL